MAAVRKLFDEAEIARRVGELAEALAATLPGEPTIVGLFKGSFVFVADLIRALDRLGVAPRVEFLRLSSYRHARESAGKVEVIGGVPTGMQGGQVLVVDDIVDTGRTLAAATDIVRAHGAARIWTCALVDKPSRRALDIAADFVGFTVPDVFVVGYGIDYAERYRHLPYIGALD